MSMGFRIPEKTEGIGYKVVRRTEVPGEFLPQFPYMLKLDILGISNHRGYCGARQDSGNLHSLFPSKEVYRLGEKCTITHNRTTWTDYGECPESREYRAGIHLWKEFPGQQILVDDFTVIKCRYENAVAEDPQVVVALTIIPLEEVGQVTLFPKEHIIVEDKL